MKFKAWTILLLSVFILLSIFEGELWAMKNSDANFNPRVREAINININKDLLRPVGKSKSVVQSTIELCEKDVSKKDENPLSRFRPVIGRQLSEVDLSKKKSTCQYYYLRNEHDLGPPSLFLDPDGKKLLKNDVGTLRVLTDGFQSWLFIENRDCGPTRCYQALVQPIGWPDPICSVSIGAHTDNSSFEGMSDEEQSKFSRSADDKIFSCLAEKNSSKIKWSKTHSFCWFAFEKCQ